MNQLGKRDAQYLSEAHDIRLPDKVFNFQSLEDSYMDRPISNVVGLAPKHSIQRKSFWMSFDPQ